MLPPINTLDISLEDGFSESDKDFIKSNPGIYRFRSGGLTIDAFVHIRTSSRSILYCGQSALHPSSRDLPVFHRISWADSFESSFVTFNDPTLYIYPSLLCGWSQGSPQSFAVLEMNKVVSAINSILPTPPKCAFYGSSAGGFWAMMMAALNSSECVVEIPQTNMFTYPWASHRELLLDRCYRDHGLDPQDYKHRLNVCDWFEYTGMAPTTIKYFQNSGDFNHTELQLEPFQKRIDEMGYQGLDVIFYERPDAEDGHTVMHKVNSVVAIRQLLS